jgi:hypothetical protein
LFGEFAMDLKIKLLEMPGAANYLIVITGGMIDAKGFERIFREIADASQSLLGCKSLIDVENATLRLGRLDTHTLDDALGSHLKRREVKIAFVSSLDVAESKRLRVLRDSLSSLGLRVAVFDDPKSAVAWLSDAT